MIKTLYKFSLDKEIEKLTPEVSKNDKGEEVTVQKKEVVKVPHAFMLRSPTRHYRDEATLYYSVVASSLTKKGVLTRSMLAKRLEKDGGVRGEEDEKEYLSLYSSLLQKQEELQRVLVKNEVERTDEEKQVIDNLAKEIGAIRVKFQAYESQRESLFDNTVESIANNKTMVWWLLHLAYKEDEKGKEVPYFGEGTFEERLAKLDDLEDTTNEFDKKTLERFYLGLSLYFSNKASEQRDFEDLIKNFEN